MYIRNWSKQDVEHDVEAQVALQKKRKQFEKLEASLLVLVGVLLGLGLFVLFLQAVRPLGSSKNSVVADDGWVYPPPPPHTEYAAVARYVAAVSSWGALATLSTHPGIPGFPFANVFSLSDGPKAAPTGVPYLYLTPMELSVKDLQENPKASLTMSLAQTDYCRNRDLDTQDPLCAHVILTGEVQKVAPGSAEEKMARAALFARHPEMAQWPEGHEWYVARLALAHIYLLDYFGGAKVIAPDDYFAASPFCNATAAALERQS